MIIDSHVHIGCFGRFDMKPDDVIGSMKRYGIDYSLVSPITGAECNENLSPLPDDWPYHQVSANEEAIAFARRNDGRIGVLLWCRPRTEGFNDAFAALADRGGTYVKGLKFHPYYSMLPITAPQVEPYLAFAAERGLPVLVHSADDEFSQPRFVYEVAKAHPAVNFIMAHVGLVTDNEEATELIGALPNLYGDTAWVRPEAGRKLIRKYGAHKLLFGTDNPIDGPDTYNHPFYRVYLGQFREWVSPEEYDLLMCGNACRLFGLS